MTQQPDWPAQRAAIEQRRAKAIEGPYFVSMDRAHDAPDHADSGLAKIETGREGDWWIARLCEWPTATFLAASWEDVGSLLTRLDQVEAACAQGVCVYCGEVEQYASLEEKTSEAGNQMRVDHIKQCSARPELKLIAEIERLHEVEAENERLSVVEALYTRRVNEPQNEAGATAVEPEDIIYALRATLTSREQRIDFLESEVARLQKERNQLAVTGAEKVCNCACRDDPRHSTVQDWAEANRYHIAKLKDVQAELAAARKANEEAWEKAIDAVKSISTGAWGSDFGNTKARTLIEVIAALEAARSHQSEPS